MKYSKLAQIYQKLESTTKLLEKTSIISDFLEKVPTSDLEHTVLLLRGKVFPDWSDQVIGIGNRLVLKAISTVSGKSVSEVEKHWKKIGDLGEVAEDLIKTKTQKSLFAEELTTHKVLQNLRKISELEGPGTVDRKIKLVCELISSADKISAKYIIRTVLETLRVGTGSGIIRDSIAKAFGVSKDNVQDAYDLITDFGVVAKTAKTKGDKGLQKLSISVGKPVKVMLAKREEDIEHAFKRVHKPAALEYKFDGFRIQAHKNKSEIKLFTRRLENVTSQFPLIAKALVKAIKADKAIIEAEATGYDPKTHKPLPFQQISQRIKRKYNIQEIATKIPVKLNVFDIIYIDNKNLVRTPFKERRKILEKNIKEIKDRVYLSKVLIISDEKRADQFYKEALKAGQEGLIFKTLDAPYKPGSRVGYMVKLKPILETLDLVITGAEWGTGKRASWLSSFELSCKKGSKFLSIGKVGTGFKEKAKTGLSFSQLTKLLKPHVKETKGRSVIIKPKIVVEVAYEEIQKSPTYESGFALRFPRLSRLRDDKGPEDVDDIKRIESIYKAQRGRR